MLLPLVPDTLISHSTYQSPTLPHCLKPSPLPQILEPSSISCRLEPSSLTPIPQPSCKPHPLEPSFISRFHMCEPHAIAFMPEPSSSPHLPSKEQGDFPYDHETSSHTPHHIPISLLFTTWYSAWQPNSSLHKSSRSQRLSSYPHHQRTHTQYVLIFPFQTRTFSNIIMYINIR